MIKVAVLSGGYSSEFPVSMKSGELIFKHINLKDFTPYRVIIKESAWSVEVDGESIPIDRTTFTYSYGGEVRRFDFAFIMIHGTPGEDGVLQNLFEKISLPYSSCSPEVARLTFDKYVCNSFLRKHEVPMASSILIKKGDTPEKIEERLRQFDFPYFVKPTSGGSSIGISKVTSSDEAADALNLAFEEYHEVMVERALTGREFSVGIWNREGVISVMGVTEIIPDNDFFDYAGKYLGASQEVTPAKLSEQEQRKICAITEKIYKLLGGRSFMRIDFILEGDTFFFIEANTVPGMSSESIIPQQLANAKITLSEFTTAIIQEGLNRG